MHKNVARRPRFKRVPDFPNIRLTDRDREILSAVLRYRFLTTSHILSFVPGSRQNIMRRLQRLYHAGFLERPKAQLPLRYAGDISELIYSPTRKAVSLLATIDGATISGNEYRQVTSLFLAHALLVSDALLSIESACRLHGTVFIPEHEMLKSDGCESASKRLQWRVTLKVSDKTETVGVIPDAAFAIELVDDVGAKRRLNFFLEIDRGTMPLCRKSLRLSSIRRKALAYSQTRRSKILKEQFGMLGFQVLFITRSKDRLERIKTVCRDVLKGRNTSLFLFATTDELRQAEALVSLGMV